MNKFATLLPIALLIAIGCSSEQTTVPSTSTDSVVDSVSSEATHSGVAMTFVSLKVPNMV